MAFLKQMEWLRSMQRPRPVFEQLTAIRKMTAASQLPAWRRVEGASGLGVSGLSAIQDIAQSGRAAQVQQVMAASSTLAQVVASCQAMVDREMLPLRQAAGVSGLGLSGLSAVQDLAERGRAAQMKELAVASSTLAQVAASCQQMVDKQVLFMRQAVGLSGPGLSGLSAIQEIAERGRAAQQTAAQWVADATPCGPEYRTLLPLSLVSALKPISEEAGSSVWTVFQNLPRESAFESRLASIKQALTAQRQFFDSLLRNAVAGPLFGSAVQETPDKWRDGFTRALLPGATGDAWTSVFCQIKDLAKLADEVAFRRIREAVNLVFTRLTPTPYRAPVPYSRETLMALRSLTERIRAIGRELGLGEGQVKLLDAAIEDLNAMLRGVFSGNRIWSLRSRARHRATSGLLTAVQPCAP